MHQRVLVAHLGADIGGIASVVMFERERIAQAQSHQDLPNQFVVAVSQQ